jgi:hypothetical protein
VNDGWRVLTPDERNPAENREFRERTIHDRRRGLLVGAAIASLASAHAAPAAIWTFADGVSFKHEIRRQLKGQS